VRHLALAVVLGLLPGVTHVAAQETRVQLTHVDVSADALHLARGRLALRGGAGWTSGARISFYSVRTGSSQDDRTNFGVEMGYVGAQLRARPVPWVVVGGSAALEDFSTRSGSGSEPTPVRPARTIPTRAGSICTTATS
jgi:hypothetical protein